MADPVRKQILDRLRSNLEAISPNTDALYHHTMAVAYVLQADQVLGGVEMPVAIVTQDGLDRHTERWSCGRTEHEMGLSIFSAIRPDPGDPEFSIEEVQHLASDITKAVEDDIQLNSLALYCEVVGDEFNDDPGEKIYWVETKLRVVYRHQLGDPTAV